MSCNNTSPITRNYIGSTAYDLRHRNSYDTCGSGVHGAQHNEEFNSTFHSTCGSWVNSFASYYSTYGPKTLDWVGDVGVMVCKTGYHGEGRAFDLTHLRASDGTVIDMNTSWNLSRSCASVTTRRRYIGTAASLRRYFGTVLTAWYNADHENHIHFDNGVAVAPIRTTAESDTTLVQATCNYLNAESLAIDGAWGPLTDAAYGRLLTKFKMGCRNPKTSTTDALLFLELIVKHGLNGAAAGKYFGPC